MMYYNLATLKIKEGEHREAVQLLNKAIEIKPNYAVAYSNRGYAQAELGFIDKAITDFGKALLHRPNYFRPLYFRAENYVKQGNYKRALIDLDRAIAINNAYPDPFYLKGVIHDWQGDNKGAAHLFDTSIKKDSEYKEKVSDYYKTIKEIRSYNKKINKNRRVGEWYLKRGILLTKLTLLSEALEDLNRALQYKTNIEGHINRAVVRNQLGDKSGALQDYDSVIKQDPSINSAYYDRAQIKASLYQLSGAIADYQKVLHSDQFKVKALVQCGQLLSEMDAYEEAIEYLDKALVSDQENKRIIKKKRSIIRHGM